MPMTQAEMEAMGLTPDEISEAALVDAGPDAVEPPEEPSLEAGAAASAPAPESLSAPAVPPTAPAASPEVPATPSGDAPEGEGPAHEAAEPPAVEAMEKAAPAPRGVEFPKYEMKGFDSEKVAARLGEIDKEVQALKDQVGAGEIDGNQFLLKWTDLQSEGNELKMQVAQARMYEDMSKSNRETGWKNSRDEFFDQHPEYTGENSTMATALLQAAMRQIEADDTDGKLSDRAVLEKAHAQVEKFLGKKPGAMSAPAKTPAVEKTPPPQTIGGLPSSANNQIGDKFAAVDGLKGLDLEDAVTKMSSEDYERYLKQE